MPYTIQHREYTGEGIIPSAKMDSGTKNEDIDTRAITYGAQVPPVHGIETNTELRLQNVHPSVPKRERSDHTAVQRSCI